jgi:CHAT domain-containing protein
VGDAQESNGSIKFTAAQVAGLDLTHTSLVVLSGRQSAEQPSASQPTLETLSQAFLYAGAQSIITGLWDVDTDATQSLMLTFYSNLRAGISKEESLRTAQIETRKKYPQPYYWAGFTLMGAKSN